MLKESAEIIKQGDRLGNGMIFRVRLPSGREVFGFGTETPAISGSSLGPTWCYFVPGRPSFLFDCGWRNLGGIKILKMMEMVGLGAADVDGIIISHCHEDHDGGLAELVQAADLPVSAHPAHALLTKFYPDQASHGARPDFPASCWHCVMPPSFSEKHCVDYHRERATVRINGLQEGATRDGVAVHHTPGHSPDAICVTIGDEAILAGDTVLPEITPHPSREGIFKRTNCILNPLGMRADQLYGIRAYIRSLKKLLAIGNRSPEMIVFPGHRLYHNSEWKEITLKERAAELIEHHLERCKSFLMALAAGPRTAREIAEMCFEPRLLKDMGIHMAVNEVICHFELMTMSGDSIRNGEKYAATGSSNYIQLINEL